MYTHHYRNIGWQIKINNCSTTLITRKVQIKTLRFYFMLDEKIPSRNKITNAEWELQVKCNLSTQELAMQTSTTVMEISMEFLQKLKLQATVDLAGPHLSIFLRDKNIMLHWNMHVHVYSVKVHDG